MYVAAGCNSLRFMERLARRYGDILHVRLAGKHYYLINHPEQIETVLLAEYQVKRSIPQPMQHALGKGLICSADEHHRRARALIQPFFQKQSTQEIAATILGYAQQQLQPWRDGDVRDIEAEMIHLTLGIILKTMVGTDFGDAIGAFANAAGTVHKNGNATPGAFIHTLLARLPLVGRYTPLGRARSYLDQTVYRLICTRRDAGTVDGKDLLSMLLRLKLHGDPETRKFITDRMIRDEVLTMLTAGHETISSALAWTWHLLSLHPEAEQALHEELETVLAGRQPSVEDLPKLRYTRMVFSESMRLYPPVWAAARSTMAELNVGGYRIPTRSRIYFTQYLVHRDARFHPDPDRFDPERFLPGEQAKRPKFSYFPFGGGNRQCIGEGLAWMEALLLIAFLGQRWRFRPVPGHPIEVEPLIALQPKFGMRMILEERRVIRQPHTEPLETHDAAV
jgi:cytochrome P450